MSCRKQHLTAWVALCGALLCSAAYADGFNGQRFEPAAGAAGGLMVEQPEVPRHLGFGAGLFVNYALNPVVLEDRAADRTVARPLQHALSFDLLGSIAFFDFLEIAFDLPIDALYRGDAVSVGGAVLDAGAGIGDLRLVPKVAWWLGGSPAINFYAGFALPLILPTGNEAALRGAGGFAIEPRALFGMGAARWRVALNVGFRSRVSSMDFDYAGAYQLTYGVAAHFGLLTGNVPLDLLLEGTGGFHPNAQAADAPLELLAGVMVSPHPDWSIYAAAGPGLTNGIASPDLRAVVGVRFARKVPGRDRYTDQDNDRIPDYRDDCKTEPEDYDGFEDEDGCPDPDNDHDGIPDNVDECPIHAEEPGGDGDGCPEHAKVVVRHGRLLIFGKIQFKVGETEPLPKSQPLLDEIASTLSQHPQFGPLRVEGHTDDIGDEGFNRTLSQKRADSVKRELVKRGVNPKILTTRGFGESNPIAPNETPAGRAQNRRVEFIVIRTPNGHAAN